MSNCVKGMEHLYCSECDTQWRSGNEGNNWCPKCKYGLDDHLLQINKLNVCLIEANLKLVAYETKAAKATQILNLLKKLCTTGIERCDRCSLSPYEAGKFKGKAEIYMEINKFIIKNMMADNLNED